MFAKLYLTLGLSMCIGLGAAFAMGWKAPDLGISKGFSGGGSRGGRGWIHTGGGFHYGK